jgi:hypothetical protein
MAMKLAPYQSIEERLRHTTFTQPPNMSIKVWRYMDVAKFVWLISNRLLFMSRLDRLGDPHEGALSKKTLEWIERTLTVHNAKDGLPAISKLFYESRLRTHVCCWHANDHESEAMWRLYCGAGGGIAIQTTYEKLVQAISNEPEIYIGLVKYIDYDKEWLPEANTFAPVMHKRIAFAHEREVRLVCIPFRGSQENEWQSSVVSIPFDCDAFIERIHVSPYAPEYFFDAVSVIVRSIAPMLESRLTWSFMKAAPVF